MLSFPNHAGAVLVVSHMIPVFEKRSPALPILVS
jgi:hypothetical protein